VTPENAKTQSWIMKTVWQRIPGRPTRNSKTPTTTVHSKTRNDHLPLTGGPQMLTTGDVGCLRATVRQVQNLKVLYVSVTFYKYQ